MKEGVLLPFEKDVYSDHMKKAAKRTYLDFASGTPVDYRVSKSMAAVSSVCMGNPSSFHKEGREAKKVLEDARKGIANEIAARPSEIFFTSGATESNNLALQGIYRSLKEKYKEAKRVPHIVTSPLEHKSVLETVAALEKEGVMVTYLEPDAGGNILASSLRKAITPDTFLVTLLHVSNETGMVTDIEACAKEVRHARRKLSMSVPGTPYLHTDAAQSLSRLSLSMTTFGADLATFHGAKVYGPAGIGFLYKRTGTPLSPILFGGGQENGLRSGRELPLLAHGFAEALSLCRKNRQKETKKDEKLRDYFLKGLKKIFPLAEENGKGEKVPGIISVYIPRLDAEFAVIYLDEKGVSISSASTCLLSSDDSYSYVIERIYADKERALSTLRISLGRGTDKASIDNCLRALEALQLTQTI